MNTFVPSPYIEALASKRLVDTQDIGVAWEDLHLAILTVSSRAVYSPRQIIIVLSVGYKHP